MTSIDFSNQSFDDIFDEVTELLTKREAENSKWLNSDGSPKRNYIWKIGSKTPQGDAGENVVRNTLDLVLSEVYGNDVEVSIENKGKGDFDIKVFIPSLDKVIKFEVKTATEDVNGAHQFNGLKKNIDYDFAFLFGVAPENFFFKIESHQHLCETMTTNMSKNVVGSYKHTLNQKRDLIDFNPQNLYNELVSCGIVD
jgi:hypothetical protein